MDLARWQRLSPLLDALLEHVSQIGQPDAFLEHMEARRKARWGEAMCYVEPFRRLIL